MNKLNIYLVICGMLLMASCSKKENENTAKMNQQKQEEIDNMLKLSTSDSAFYLEKGSDLMGEAKQVISSTLVDAMEDGGVSYAAKFCNIQAYPILDSISKANKAVLRRVSDKPRNPKDTMDYLETAAFANFKAQMEKGVEAPEGIIVDEKHYVRYLAPIKISMETCLKCHGGVGKEIKEADYKYLSSLYPADKAIDYKNGDLRGVFSIRLEKAHQSIN